MDSDDGQPDFFSDDDVEQEYFVNDSQGNSHDHSDHQNYVVLNEADILRRQQDDITTLSTILSITRSESSTLLTHYNWSVSKVNEEWFADEDRVRKSVGLFTNYNPNDPVLELTCGICFDTFDKDQIFDARSCGHPFCGSCWGGYISNSINDGPGCLTLRCPDPSCSSAVGRDMVDALVASDDDRKRYARYLGRSYVEDNKEAKWCPAPGCDFAVYYSGGSGGNSDVICNCLHGFCWNCGEEAHRPVDCETVKEWILKNSSEAENTKWILANAKPCPKCKRPIEKNQGCMVMTCRPPCGFRFCWLCLAPHGYSTCNMYKGGDGAKKSGDDQKRRETAKKSLERYAHYYERYAANKKSRQKAVMDLDEMQKVQLEKLSEMQSEPETQLRFVVEAWSQIVECRRVLKWTYAYGYYLPEEESAKRELFEFLQGQAEVGLERLHHCAEKEIKGYLIDTPQGLSNDFTSFRKKLVCLTSVTKNYFENLMRALENGLSDVDSLGVKRRKRMGLDDKASTSSGAAPDDFFYDDYEDDFDYWPCDRCTFLNLNTATSCHMCNQQA